MILRSSELPRNLIFLIPKKYRQYVFQVMMNVKVLKQAGSCDDPTSGPGTVDTGLTAYAAGWGFLYEQDHSKEGST